MGRDGVGVHKQGLFPPIFTEYVWLVKDLLYGEFFSGEIFLRDHG